MTASPVVLPESEARTMYGVQKSCADTSVSSSTHTSQKVGGRCKITPLPGTNETSSFNQLVPPLCNEKYKYCFQTECAALILAEKYADKNFYEMLLQIAPEMENSAPGELKSQR